MDYFDEIKTFLMSIPIVGKIVTISIFVYAINEVIDKITLEKINPLGKLFSFIPALGRKHVVNIREKYYKTLNTEDFINWEYNALKKIYKEHSFTHVLNAEYPVVCFETASICSYPFNGIYNKDKLDTNINDEFKINSKIQKEYYKIVNEKIKRSKLPGFMLNKLILDENDKIIEFNASTGTYEQNVYTSHILEYELYKAYINKKIDVETLNSRQILELLPLRNNIHKGRTEMEVLSTGLERYSLIGVQMLVLYKDHIDNEYNILFIKRSDDVAAKPGFFQFVPSGGFEIFENEDAIADLKVRPRVLKNNFSLEKAIFRELVEEVFGEEEFIHNNKGVPVDDVLCNEHVLKIMKMIDNKEAHFELLGSIIDLVGLRHEFSFILRIDNTDFSKERFRPNHESANIDNCKISQIEESINKDKLNQGSAGLLYLAKQNHIYKEVAPN